MPSPTGSTLRTALALVLLSFALVRVAPEPAARDGSAAGGGADALASVPAEGEAACTGQRFIGQRVACYSDRAVRQGDPRICLRARTPDVRWPCVAKYAVVAGDAATCGLLPGPPLRNGDTGSDSTAGSTDPGAPDPMAMDPRVTVDLCLTTLALVWRKPVLCQLLETPAMDDTCLAKLVAIGGDPALCRDIESKELREVCRPGPSSGGGE